MNKVILIGRLTKDPVVGNNNAKFTVAVNRVKDGADFLPCVAFGKTAELISQYMTKGSPIALEGRIQTGSYTTKDGETKYTTDVIVDRFEFVGGAKQEQAPKKSREEYLEEQLGGDLEVVDGDIPF